MIRSMYDGKSARVGAPIGQDGRTKQSFKDECDINQIIKRMEVTGQIHPTQTFDAGTYGDFSNIDDYQSALNQTIAAQQNFDSLPSRVRSRFDNDPAKLIDFMDDEDNYEEAISLGLVNKPEPTPPDGGETPPIIGGE